MKEFWFEIFRNKALWVTLVSWMVAQGLKIFIGLIRGEKFNFNWILRTGGMPSAHSAAVVALAFSVGQSVGFSSAIFALAAIVALITMFDAQTWRRSIGVQARILNVIVEDIQHNKKVGDDKLRELVGHTPVEVLAGVIIGIATFLFFYF